MPRSIPAENLKKGMVTPWFEVLEDAVPMGEEEDPRNNRVLVEIQWGGGTKEGKTFRHNHLVYVTYEPPKRFPGVKFEEPQT